MRVRSRVGGGGFLILTMVVVLALAYQVTLVQRMGRISQQLNSYSKAETVCRDLFDNLDQTSRVLDYHRTAGDSDSQARLLELADAFQSGLDELPGYDLEPAEKDTTEILQVASTRFSTQLRLWLQRVGEEKPAELPDEIRGGLDRLEGILGRLIKQTSDSVQLKVEESNGISGWALRVSLASGLFAIVVALVLAFFILRSFTRPLDALIEGTRRVAREDYSARVDESGDDEIAELARTFNFAARRLKEVDQVKRDFVSYVSHDLKGPLASMRETTSLLMEEIPGPLTPQQLRLLELNQQCGDRLSAMIRNLLDLSRLESGLRVYEFVEQDLRPLVARVVEEVESLLIERGCRADLDIPDSEVLARCDRMGLLQVVRNLLDNALRFAPEGTSIGVRVAALKDFPEGLPDGWGPRMALSKSGYAMVSVSESGVGVEDSEKSRIFAKFHRTHRKESNQGFGLGLAICRIIIEGHKGAIWVEDNPGGGSVFSFLIGASLKAGAKDQP